MSAEGMSMGAKLQEIAMAAVRPVAFGRAGELLDVVGPRSYLHAGPPLKSSETVGAMRGGLIGALLLEREAESFEEAEALVARDALELRPCHDANGAGALAGIVSPSVPVVVAEREGGLRAFGTIVEGLGRALSFGNFDETTIARVRWLGGEFSEVLNEAFAQLPPIDIIELQAKSLRRGDECHNRLVAATESLVAMLSPAFVRMGPAALPTLEALRGNPHFFLSLSIAAAKTVALAIEADGPPGIVTALAGNGIECGLKVSGAPGQWFVAPAPAPVPERLMVVKEKTAADAAPLMGDSGVTETVGLGAMSLTASLSLARVLGLNAAQAADVVAQMRGITVTTHPRYLLPADDFRGSPFGISVEKVLATGVTPAVNAGYADRVPGRGRVGAAVDWYPLAVFERAAASLR